MGNAEEDDMADTTATPAVRSAEHPLIESHRVEGTRVFDRDGKHVGTIDHLVIEKVSGRVVYVVASFGGFLGLGERLHTIPWERLDYDPERHAYRVEVTEAELQDAPSLPHDADEEREEMLRAYWALGPHGL
jgi:sporulation protein YlmC with PRC-barrel domain